jgi:F0F1-type ATP synthase assembly protein I
MSDKPTAPKPDNRFMRYSGIGFQLAATIGAGVFIGYELDKWQKTSQPYYTIGFSILFLVAGFYMMFKELMRR